MNIVVDKDLQELSYIFGKNANFNLLSLAPENIKKENIKLADALFLRSVTKIDDTLLKDTNVKFVASLTSGEDHIDHEMLKKTAINLSTGKGGNTSAVVEYFFSALSILLIEKKIIPYKTKIGIIGFGRIGKKIKSILDLIEFPNTVYDPYLPECVSSLEDVLDCDLISLHCSYSTTGKFPSHHLLNKSHYKKIIENKYLINTSRGEVLSEEFFQSKGEKFIFDVWAKENDMDFSKIQKPFIATPHTAGKTFGAENNFTKNAIKDFNSFFDQKIESSNLDKTEELKIDKSIEEEIKIFGIPAALILKIYNIKEDDLSFKKFFESRQVSKSFQDLRISLKRKGFDNYKLVGELNSKSKAILELLGFRL
ncbi:MAG: hypothetical protein EVA47_01105 [Gammaproteobacteria bacterium]|nr:MAG: hypothetical protein EVA47_01105 [Gammaproteobacteria bacterium]